MPQHETAAGWRQNPAPVRGSVIVVTLPEDAAGFQLAGVETFAVETAMQAESLLRRLAAEEEASIIMVHPEFLEQLDPILRRQLEAHYPPIIVALPHAVAIADERRRRQYIAELIRRAIGFRISFTSVSEEGVTEP
ncbi:MAG: V-type ATP synthase subunit F [Acidobacteria bacterium]|nr:V-type ATP synthase subunit F [Acidobacteriota bacterium]